MSRPTTASSVLALLVALALSGCVVEEIRNERCGLGPNMGGREVPPSFPIEMGRSAGTFDFRYETRSAKDRVRVLYEGVELFDSGCVSETRQLDISYGPGEATQIEVVVETNCEEGNMTSWRFDVGCPKAPDVQVTPRPNEHKR